MAEKMVMDETALNVETPLQALYVSYESETTAHIMAALGVRVKGVEDTFQALDVLLRSGHSYHIISINMDLPCALELIVILRGMGIGSKLVGFTNQEEEKIVEFLHEGLDYCLQKPVVSFHSIAAVLEQIYERIHEDD